MTERRARNLLLALGNDILGDDGVAHYAARELRELFPEGIDIEESGEAGLAILEYLTGYERALIVDAICTGQHKAGSIIEFQPQDFRRVIAPSPHYAGIPEVFELAERIGAPLPRDLRIVAMEVNDPYTLCEGLTEEVAEAMPALVERLRAILTEWGLTATCMSTH